MVRGGDRRRSGPAAHLDGPVDADDIALDVVNDHVLDHGEMHGVAKGDEAVAALTTDAGPSTDRHYNWRICQKGALY